MPDATASTAPPDAGSVVGDAGGCVMQTSWTPVVATAVGPAPFGRTFTIDAPEAPDPGPSQTFPPTVRACRSGRWCFDAPTPFAEIVGAVWGASPNDVWIAGTDVAVLRRWDGTRWTEWPVDPPTAIAQIGGTGASDVWAVGARGTVLHFDGTSWTSTTIGSADLHGVWPAAVDDAWAVGDNGYLAHFDGTGWTQRMISTVRLDAIWGAAPDDVWAFGHAGTALHFDGKTWTPSTIAVADAIRAWGDRTDDIYVIVGNELYGDGGSLLRWNGAAWATIQAPWNNAYTVDVLGALPTGQVVIGGSDHTSSGFVGLEAASGVGGVWSALSSPGYGCEANANQPALATDSSTLWASTWHCVGYFDLERWDGNAWHSYEAVRAYSGTIWGASDAAWVVEDFAGEARARGPDGWHDPWDLDRGDYGTFRSRIAARAANDVWVVFTPYSISLSRLAHFDGVRWTEVELDVEAGHGGLAITEAARDDVWFIVADQDDEWSGSLVHVTGATSQVLTVDGGARFVDVWADRPDDVWALSTENLYRFDGVAWRRLDGGTCGATALHGAAADDVWLTAPFYGESYVWHWNGSTWQSQGFAWVPGDVDVPLVAPTGNGRAWIYESRGGGDDSRLSRSDGASLQPVALPAHELITSLYSDPASGVTWAYGSHGTVLRFSP